MMAPSKTRQNRPGRPSRPRQRRWRSLAPGLAGLALMAACNRENTPPEAPPALSVPVAVAPVVEKTMPFQVRTIGNVAASATVSVRSRIGGTLQRVHFREGEEVSQGQLLFVIDPRPYEAALRQAEALLARDRALLEKAEADLKRVSELVRHEYVTQEQYDQARATAASFRAAVQADEAAEKKAYLDLSYCSVVAPISGRTGDLLVDEGNLVKANDDLPLVVIHQISPIEVSFSVPQQYLPQIRARQAEGPLRATVLVEDQDHVRPVEGRLSFVNNTVDTRTGTVLLKASFPNQDRALWPGQFADVVLTLAEQSAAIVAPSEAIQSGQQGPYVFVVGQDGTAESRPVVVSRIVGEEAVIGQGLAPGERVVIDGQLRLMPGSRVEIKASPAAQGASR